MTDPPAPAPARALPARFAAAAREAIWVDGAFAAARAVPAERAASMRAFDRAARERAHHARALGPAPAAFALWREAVALRGAVLAVAAGEPPPSGREALTYVASVLDASGDPRRDALAEGLSTVAESDPIAFDRWTDDERAARLAAVDDLVDWLGGRVEARSTARLWAERGARVAAVVAALAGLAWVARQTVFAPPDRARGATVTASSRDADSPDPSALVDGKHDPIGARTEKEPRPSITIELARPISLDTLRIRNRTDGHFDEGLPFVVETATLHGPFVELARRTDSVGPGSWEIDGGQRAVAKIRIRLERVGYLALGDVEAFGKPR